MIWRTPLSTLFPYTTLFRSNEFGLQLEVLALLAGSQVKLGQRFEQLRRLRRALQLLFQIGDHFFEAAGLDEALRSEEHTSELQSLRHLVCRLLLEKKKQIQH